jgi:hypothetical protein
MPKSLTSLQIVARDARSASVNENAAKKNESRNTSFSSKLDNSFVMWHLPRAYFGLLALLTSPELRRKDASLRQPFVGEALTSSRLRRNVVVTYNLRKNFVETCRFRVLISQMSSSEKIKNQYIYIYIRRPPFRGPPGCEEYVCFMLPCFMYSCFMLFCFMFSSFFQSFSLLLSVYQSGIGF